MNEKINKKEEDRLKDMFDRCAYFSEKIFNHKVPSRNYPQKIPMHVTSIIAELGEILEEYQGWKDWRNNPPSVDEEHLIEEIADLWHFVIHLTLFLGYDSEELYEAFLKKSKKNFERQENEY